VGPTPRRFERSENGPERALEANSKSPKRTARKLLLPRAYSASGGPFPRPKTYSGAGMVRSEPWRRTANPQKRAARKLFLLRAYSASAGPFPRSPLKDINIVCSVPFYVNRWDPQAIRAERCRAVASLGGEHPNPSRTARKLLLPRAYSASGGPMPRSPDTAEPTKNRSGTVSVRSEPWRRTANPPSAQRESSSSSEPTQRAQDRSRGAH
jgi:hypothetical protein